MSDTDVVIKLRCPGGRGRATGARLGSTFNVSLKAGNNVGRPELYLDREVELELELEQKDD